MGRYGKIKHPFVIQTVQTVFPAVLSLYDHQIFKQPVNVAHTVGTVADIRYLPKYLRKLRCNGKGHDLVLWHAKEHLHGCLYSLHRRFSFPDLPAQTFCQCLSTQKGKPHRHPVPGYIRLQHTDRRVKFLELSVFLLKGKNMPASLAPKSRLFHIAGSLFLQNAGPDLEFSFPGTVIFCEDGFLGRGIR